MAIDIKVGDLLEAKKQFRNPDFVRFVVENRLRELGYEDFRINFYNTHFVMITKHGVFSYKFSPKVRPKIEDKLGELGLISSGRRRKKLRKKIAKLSKNKKITSFDAKRIGVKLF